MTMWSGEQPRPQELVPYTPDFAGCAGRPDVYRELKKMEQNGAVLHGSQQDYNVVDLSRIFEMALNEVRASGIHDPRDPRLDRILADLHVTSAGGFREAIRRIAFVDVEESWGNKPN